MTNQYQIIGDVNNRGTFEVSQETSVREILEEHAGGMKNRRPVKLVQIGGVLGKHLRGRELNETPAGFTEHIHEKTILFLNDRLCPVDYLRFLTRFTIRELGIDNDHTRRLNCLIEGIAQGKGSETTLNQIIDEVKKEAETNGEQRLHEIFLYIIGEFKEEFQEHISLKKCRNGICRGLFKAQCINACPAEVYIPGYIELMKQNREEDAYRLMRQNNPLSFVCGSVCARPCEDRCRRGEIESSVGVRALKRYASAMSVMNSDFREDRLGSNSSRVAIVGSGPAGLTAAYYLARTGYSVDIYEAEKVAGGMLAMGIPEYRLSQAAIDREVELIENLGVKIRTSTKIGKEIQLDELRKQYDAVLLATGCHIGNRIGPETGQSETAVDFLREVRVHGRRQVGDKVLVVGGGDVAIDAARTAVRLGAENVSVASLETFDRMPASLEEKTGALEEGVEFIDAWGIGEILFQENRIHGVRLRKCTSLLDDDGKFSPVYDDSLTMETGISHIIFAMGQKPDMDYLSRDIGLNQYGWIDIDPCTRKTSADNVFAAGDMIRPGIAIEAIAQGRSAAESIDRFLKGSGIYLGNDIEIPEQQLNCTMWDIEKVGEAHLKPSFRTANFKSVTSVFSREEAMREASRCMRCDRNSIQPLYLK